MAVIYTHTHLVLGRPTFEEWAARAGAEHALAGLLAEVDANRVERAILMGRMRHPQLKIILAQAGQHWLTDAGEIAREHPTGWADLSGGCFGARPPPHAECIKDPFREFICWAAGSERLLPGSDWPLRRMRPYLKFSAG